MGFGVRGSEEPAGSSARSLLPCPVAETVAPRVKLPIPPCPPPTASGTQFSRAWVWSFSVLVGGAPRSLPPPAVADFPWHDGLQVHAPVAGGKTFYLFQGRVILRGTHDLRPCPPGRCGRLGRSRAVVDAGRRPRPEGAIPCPRAHSGVGLPAAQPFRPELFLRAGPPGHRHGHSIARAHRQGGGSGFSGPSPAPALLRALPWPGAGPDPDPLPQGPAGSPHTHCP